MEGPKRYKIMGFHCPECFDNTCLPYNTEEEQRRADKIRFCGNCDVGENSVTKITMDYVPADLVRELVEKGTDLVDVLDKLIHPAFVGYAKIEAFRAALAAWKAMEG